MQCVCGGGGGEGVGCAKTGFSSEQKKCDLCSREFTGHLSGQSHAVVLKTVLKT